MPFFVVRGFLPKDGEPIRVWRGERDKWPKQSSSFLKHETGEVAFGKGIRANPNRQGKETDLSPGITAEKGFIHIHAGWRIHKNIPFWTDYYDGEYEADAYLQIKDGKPIVDIQPKAFRYNAPWAARLLGEPMIRAFSFGTKYTLTNLLEEALEKSLAETLQTVKQTTRVLEVVNVTVAKDTVVVEGRLNGTSALRWLKKI
ncbi:MAG: hypothetical protein KTR14_03675 [Vampirovibrio sp.]|nr:hypothetical protein [Vampirovibrio sp.]